MNRVDTICPWCFEIQDTGVVRKMTRRANEYVQQDPLDPDCWEECLSSSHETCKNCNKEFIWQLRPIVVAEVSKLEWGQPLSAAAMTPKVVGLIPTKLEEKDDEC
jgi:hypothetical protein